MCFAVVAVVIELQLKQLNEEENSKIQIKGNFLLFEKSLSLLQQFVNMSSDDEDMECEYQLDSPEEEEVEEEETSLSLPQALPSVSQAKYNTAYELFQKWNMVNGATPVTENVLLKYFADLTKRSKPTTLFAVLSMLKATLRINDGIDIAPWSKLFGFVKTQNAGYIPTKANLFTKEEIEKFIDKAPDEEWLDAKVKRMEGKQSASFTLVLKVKLKLSSLLVGRLHIWSERCL